MAWHWWLRGLAGNGGGCVAMSMLSGIGSIYCSCHHHHHCQVATILLGSSSSSTTFHHPHWHQHWMLGYGCLLPAAGYCCLVCFQRHGRRGRTLSQVQGGDGKMAEKVAEEKNAEFKKHEAMAMQVMEVHQNEAVAGNAAQQGTTP